MMLWLYLTDFCEKLKQYSDLIVLIGFLFIAILGFLIPFIEERERNLTRKYLKTLTYISLISFFISIIIPSSKTLYLMMGIKYTQDIKFNEIPLYNKSMKLLEEKIDSLLKERKINDR